MDPVPEQRPLRDHMNNNSIAHDALLKNATKLQGCLDLAGGEFGTGVRSTWQTLERSPHRMQSEQPHPQPWRPFV
jgi:hypothetical protein